MEIPSILQEENKEPSIPQVSKRKAPTSPESLAVKLEAQLDDPTEDNREEDETASEEENAPVQHLSEQVDDDSKDEEKHLKEEDTRETEKPLIEDDTDNVQVDKDSVKIKIDGDNNTKDEIDRPPKKKVPMYLFPITRMKLAWTRSSNICEFLLKATFIIFSTLGWLFCVGGIPLMSLAMLVIGIVYKNDCKMQPNIPVYLIVSGALGTFQHFLAVWIKYIPKESQGRIRLYRAYGVLFDGILQLFLLIWFVLGCIWVYGIYSTVEFEESYKDEYCNKTVYLFSFWVLNLSFIFLSIIIVFSFCVILCIIGEKD